MLRKVALGLACSDGDEVDAKLKYFLQREDSHHYTPRRDRGL
jgi:hypothetical protein